MGTLDSRIGSYRTDPQTVPASEILRAAARQLFNSGDKQSAREVLEFVFAREIEEHKLEAANFLGLAEIRIAAGDTPGAVELLRRLVVVVGNPFENLDPAAALLEKTGHNAEAIEFLVQLVKASPWEPGVSLAAGESKSRRRPGRGIGTENSYRHCIGDGRFLQRAHPSGARLGRRAHAQVELGSAELNLLAGGPADDCRFRCGPALLLRSPAESGPVLLLTRM